MLAPGGQNFDWRRALLRTGILVAAVAAIALALNAGLFRIEGDTLAAHLAVPSRIAVAAAGEQSVTLTATLRNGTGQTVQLAVPTACHVFRWAIAAEDGRFVQSALTAGCAPDTRSRTLQPGETIEEEVTLTLDGRRFRSGERYQMRYAYWGVDGEAVFTATD